MIIMRINSGMGNQMFQYAAGLAAAYRLNTELLLEKSAFNSSKRDDRPYFLDCFPAITEPEASFSQIWSISKRMAIVCFIMNMPGRKTNSGKRRHIFQRAINKVNCMIHDKGVYLPSFYSYSPEFENVPDNTCMMGYWESWKIFAGIEDIVRAKFKFSPECFSSALSDRVRSCNSVAVHVRRGDKTSLKGFFASDGLYLKNALTRLTALTEKPEFFVFSDDIDWCRANLPQIYDAEYTYISGQTPAQDMALMTQCRHVILAPSSFSWWGAWLNENPHKIVIAPDINLWYPHGAYNPEDRKYLLPPEWLKIR